MPDEKSAGIVLFREGGRPRFLLLHYEEGHWDMPKGHIEPGEGEHEAAVRECVEETGIGDITFIPGFREKVEYTYMRDGRPSRKEVYYFLASTSEEKVTLSREHQGYAWLVFEDALPRLTYENAREILRLAQRQIKKSGS